MVSPAVAQAPPAHKPRLLRWLWWLVFAIVFLFAALVAGVAGWFYRSAKTALPQLDGSVPVAGVRAPVTVIRDDQGVPHIRAADLHDLMFAQGYVTAQDRLWQMDITRRFAAGELAEIMGADFFGTNLLQHDREQRILQLRVSAERSLANMPAGDREYLDDYARGVNAYIASRRGRMPVEFRVLRYRPREWTPVDSLVIGANMSEMLNHWLFRESLLREKLLEKLGPELTKDLFPNTSWRDHPPGSDDNIDRNPTEPPPPDEPQNETRLGQTAPLLAALLNFDPAEPLIPGSNNWAVSGAHTASGKPLLSNDMHLRHSKPDVWYEAHLQAGDLDVAGVTLPGVPFVIVGHNQRIAWGFTNLGPDVEDIYVENFNAAGEYQTPSGWQKPEHRRELIHVRKAADVVLDVVVTRHGPIVSEIAPGETRKIALKWVLYDPACNGSPFFQLNAAENWEQFRQALAHFGTPSQNVVYADVEGNIGYQATGCIPERAGEASPVPVSGADDQHEWTGYVPFDALPRAFNPPSGIVATANGRIAPDGYAYHLARQWMSPYRTERIYRVLSQDKKFTPADMLALQTDIYSDFHHFLAQRFVYAVDHDARATERMKEAADFLRQWDGKMNESSTPAALVELSRRTLVKLLQEPKLAELREEYQTRAMSSSMWLEEVLLHQPARWLPETFQNYDQVLAEAVKQTVEDRNTPAKLIDLNWGDLSEIEIAHPIFSQIPLLHSHAGTELLPQSGSSQTVKQVGRNFGPSERMTVDFSDLDHSTLNIVTGESGNIFSPHYMDQWDAWYRGQTFILPFSEEAVRKAKLHELVLTPAGR